MTKWLFIIFFATLFIFPVYAQTCLTSSEEYAVETVVPSYSLTNLKKISVLSSVGYITNSQYAQDLVTIAKETSIPEGLSIRLQIPTKLNEVKTPHVKIFSTIGEYSIEEINLNSLGGWQILCSENSCSFEKDKKIITINEAGEETEITLEINEKLQPCSETCSGVCITTPSEPLCIDSKTKSEVEVILRYFKMAVKFEDLLDFYKTSNSNEIIFTDIIPEKSPYINWQEAMRQELVFLNSKEVIKVSREDIESIVSLTRRGQAGQNHRIVYAQENQSWTYYNKLPNAMLTSQKDCTSYEPIKKIQPFTANIIGVTKNPFYLVPLILFLVGLLALGILVIIATIIRKRMNQETLKEI